MRKVIIVYGGDVSKSLLILGSRFPVAATFALALGLSADVYVVIAKMARSTMIGIGVGSAYLLVLLGFWHVSPLLLRSVEQPADGSNGSLGNRHEERTTHVQARLSTIRDQQPIAIATRLSDADYEDARVHERNDQVTGPQEPASAFSCRRTLPDWQPWVVLPTPHFSLATVMMRKAMPWGPP
jgi:hypothetical protein